MLPPLTATVPCEAAVVPVTDSASPSTSVSFANTLIVTGVSSAVVAESLLATGASLTPTTVMSTVAVADPPCPSLIV